MSSPADTIDTYISNTLSAEQQAAADAAQQKIDELNQQDQALRAELQSALDRDDKKKAIKLAYALMEDTGEDTDIDKLYDFLLSRVGVYRREPFFAMSLQPVVQWVSGICVAGPLILLTAHVLAPAQQLGPEQTDVFSCLGAALVFGTPLWDVLFAATYNYVNRYRLIE